MVQENFIHVDGNKIRYLETGDTKNILVLLHGLGASAERWNNVIPYFSKNYHLIIPDLVGFGYSDKPLVDYTMDFFSDFLGKFIKVSNLLKDLGHQRVIGLWRKNCKILFVKGER